MINVSSNASIITGKINKKEIQLGYLINDSETHIFYFPFRDFFYYIIKSLSLI